MRVCFNNIKYAYKVGICMCDKKGKINVNYIFFVRFEKDLYFCTAYMFGVKIVIAEVEGITL